MKGIVGVTGTPGTGKKTVSPLVAGALGLDCMSLNDLARSLGLLKPGGEDQGVDTEKMKSELAKVLPPRALVYGHLFPYVVPPGRAEKVAVLRCEPATLKKRLARRSYPASKVTENVEAELIGVVSADSYRAFGGARTFEVDTTRSSPRETAALIGSIALGEAEPGPRLDWTALYDSGEKLRSLLSG